MSYLKAIVSLWIFSLATLYEASALDRSTQVYNSFRRCGTRLAVHFQGSTDIMHQRITTSSTTGVATVYYIDRTGSHLQIRAFSSGSDRSFGTSDDYQVNIPAALVASPSNLVTLPTFDGRYLYLMRRNTQSSTTSISRYDLGRDEELGTADDGQALERIYQTSSDYITNVRVDSGIVAWEFSNAQQTQRGIETCQINATSTAVGSCPAGIPQRYVVPRVYASARPILLAVGDSYMPVVATSFIHPTASTWHSFIGGVSTNFVIPWRTVDHFLYNGRLALTTLVEPGASRSYYLEDMYGSALRVRQSFARGLAEGLYTIGKLSPALGGVYPVVVTGWGYRPNGGDEFYLDTVPTSGSTFVLDHIGARGLREEFFDFDVSDNHVSYLVNDRQNNRPHGNRLEVVTCQ